ncbi:hypothetical protein ABW21_db0208301 [Orbilia brochopaga]|nr:hypothetical protein ABW21_db0208301 [Drechslerella brochopaga]
MRFTTIVTAALAVVTTAVTGFDDLKHFKVKSRVIEGNTKFCGLWGTLYHTGAGFWDVWFQNNQTLGFDAFINNTQFQWSAGGQDGVDFPYSLNLEYQTYSAWGPLEVTTGYGSDYYGKNYTIADNGTIISTFEEWVGWLSKILPCILSMEAHCDSSSARRV